MALADERSEAARWERVHQLFGDALDLMTKDRAEFLARECANDAELRTEVESLLKASRESDEYFGDLADRAGLTLSSETGEATDPLGFRDRESDDKAKELVGERIGQYRVLEWIGRGGTASVYLAERDGDGFTQRVALKVVQRRLKDRLIEGRSSEERRILARLEHRSIARLIDGGVTPAGFPFYAMEFVDGTDVLSYCDEQQLGMGDRLALFLEVCAPVQFAHEQLVIHCDLKPNNILVTPDGHVKLLDFGVARLIDPDSAGGGEAGLFTPAYASPEQVRREPPGTASDVYSLGVLLYVMLTGRMPYRFETPMGDEIVRTVAEVVPAVPSEVVTQPGRTWTGGTRAEGSAADLSGYRSTTPSDLKRDLRGDLDAIVMKALAKDPPDRYTTVEQLASDIGRHLAHEPVTSVPLTTPYRARKFVRRNRGTVLAAAVIALALAGGVGTTLWQASLATSAAEAAAEEAEKAKRVADLMSELFRLSDPQENLGDAVTARDMLDRGTERILTEFGDQPVVQADLLAEVARIYNNLGAYDEAEPLVQRAIDLRSEQFGPLSAEVSEGLISMGKLRANLSDPNGAIELLSHAIDIRGPLFEEPDPLLVEAKATLGWALRETGNNLRAAQLFTEALAEQRLLDPSAHEIADLMFGQASSFHDDGMLEAADSVFNEVLANIDPDARPDPNAVSALRRVGMVRRLREQYSEAEPLLEAAVDMGTRLYGPDHGLVLNATQEYLLNQTALGRWQEGEEGYRDALGVSLSSLGEGHELTARLQEGLAVLLEYRGEYAEAVGLQKASLLEKVLRHQDRDHPGVVASLVAVGRILALHGEIREAREYLAEAELMNERLGAGRGVTAMSIARARGIIARAEGDFGPAEAHVLDAISIGEEVLTRPSHRYLTGARTEYADVLLAAGRMEEASEVLVELERLLIQRIGERHPLLDEVRARQARARAG